MGTCNDNVFLDITYDCSTDNVGGMEILAYAFYRQDLTATYDGTVKTKITDLAIPVGKKGFKILQVKNSANAKSDLTVRTDAPDRYKHTFSFKISEMTAEAIENADKLNDLVVVVERKQKNTTGNGVFQIYGLESGLWKATSARDLMANDGTRMIEMASMDESLEKHEVYIFLKTDYATSKAKLDALMITQV